MAPKLPQLAFVLSLVLGTQAAMATTTAYTGSLPGQGQAASYGPNPWQTVYIGPGTVGQSQSTLTFSNDLLLTTYIAKMSAIGSSGSQVTLDADGYYLSASFFDQESIGTLVMDDKTHAIQGVTAAMGITLTAPPSYNISIGGSLTLQSLSINLNDHLVYGNILGSNGIVAQSNVALFSFSNTDVVLTQGNPLPLCAPDSAPSGCDFYGAGLHAGLVPYNISLTDAQLMLTPQGLDAISQSLGFWGTSKATLASIDSFGTLSISTDFYAAPDYFPPAVPEPGSMALMGLGLAGLVGVQRRRQMRKGA